VFDRDLFSINRSGRAVGNINRRYSSFAFYIRELVDMLETKRHLNIKCFLRRAIQLLSLCLMFHALIKRYFIIKVYVIR